MDKVLILVSDFSYKSILKTFVFDNWDSTLKWCQFLNLAKLITQNLLVSKRITDFSEWKILTFVHLLLFVRFLFVVNVLEYRLVSISIVIIFINVFIHAHPQRGEGPGKCYWSVIFGRWIKNFDETTGWHETSCEGVYDKCEAFCV